MAELSTMQALGSIAPDFTLPDTISGQDVSLSNVASDVATVIMFICNHCPFVQHVNSELVSLSNEYMAKGVSFAAISANDAENYPEDSPDKMKQYAERLGYKFPYLYDDTQEVAKTYGAACTPDFFVYDKDLKLVYRGRMDGSTPGNDVPLTGEELRAALDAIIAGQPVNQKQTPSVGCGIKWRE